MQILPGPGLLAGLRLRLLAQLLQSRPGVFRPIVVRGETRQVSADQSVHRGIALGGIAADRSENLLVKAQSDVPHNHSL